MDEVKEPIAADRINLEKDGTIRERKGTIAVGLQSVADFMLENYNTLNEPSAKRSLNQSISCKDLQFLSSCSFATINQSKEKKFQSLPMRRSSLPRPLSLGDDFEETLLKLHFTKRRRNRMQNDSAAAIALNKSRSVLLQSLCNIEIQELLMYSDAVVIYDEHTSL